MASSSRFLRDVDGQDMEKIADDTYATIFRSEKSGSPLRIFMEDTMEDDVVPVAFTYEGGTAKFFALWLGDVQSLAVHLNRHPLYPKYQGMLECTRGKAVRFILDIDDYVYLPEEVAPKQAALVSTITDIVIKNVKRLKLQTDNKQASLLKDLRIFSGTRVVEDGRTKISMRIFLRGLAFEDTGLCGAYVSHLFRDKPELLGAVDLSVYKMGQYYRLPWAWKKHRDDGSALAPQQVDWEPIDGWSTAVFQHTVVYSKAMLLQKIPSLERLMTGLDTVHAHLGVEAMPATDNFLNHEAMMILGERLGKKGLKFKYHVGPTHLNIVPYQCTMCLFTPGRFHSGTQHGMIGCDLKTLHINLHCFGKDCSEEASAMQFDSVGTMTAVRLACIQVCPPEVLGVPMTDEYVLPLLPAGPWRLVEATTQRYLVSESQVIVLQGRDTTVLDKTDLTTSHDAEIIQSKPIAAMLMRDKLVDMIGYEVLPVMTDKEYFDLVNPQLSKQSSTPAVLAYLKDLFKSRGIRIHRGKLYHRNKKYPMLLEAVDLPEMVHWGTPGKVSPLVCWLNAEIHKSGPPHLKMIMTHSRFSHDELERAVATQVGSQIEVVPTSEAYAFRNGILHLPTSPDQKELKDLFVGYDVMRREGKTDPIMPVTFIDVDFDPMWCTDRHFDAFLTVLRTQEFDDTTIDTHLSMSIGRMLTRWSLGEDSLKQNVALYGPAGNGKSMLVKLLMFLQPRFAEISKGREGLGSLVPYRDCNCRLIIGQDIQNVNLSMFKSGFSTEVFKMVATGEPVHITDLWTSKTFTEVLRAPMIVVANNRKLGWFMCATDVDDLEGMMRRVYPIAFDIVPKERDDQLEVRAMEPDQIGAVLVYSIQRYMDMRATMSLADLESLEHVRIQRDALLYLNSPIHQYLDFCSGFDNTGGESDLDIPRLRQGFPTSYVTPRAFREAVTKFVKEKIGNSLFTSQGIQASSILRYVKPLGYEIVYQTGAEKVRYCGRCFDDGGFVLEGACKAHKDSYTKFFRNGTILGATTDNNEEPQYSIVSTDRPGVFQNKRVR